MKVMTTAYHLSLSENRINLGEMILRLHNVAPLMHPKRYENAMYFIRYESIRRTTFLTDRRH